MDDKLVATLVGALIAAVASIVTLVLRSASERRAELRLAFRKSLETSLVELGESLHSIVACSTLVVQCLGDDKQREAWRSRAGVAQKTLRSLRPRLRYQLWGIDDGLRTLIRLPDWVSRAHTDLDSLFALLRASDRLRASLDRAILQSYRTGAPPGLWTKARVALADRAVRQKWRALRFSTVDESELSDDAQEFLRVRREQTISKAGQIRHS